MQEVWDCSQTVVGASLLAKNEQAAGGCQAASVIVDDHREQGSLLLWFSGVSCLAATGR